MVRLIQHTRLVQAGALVIVCASSAVVEAQSLLENAETLVLWPDGAPGAVGDTEADRPTLLVCRPPQEKSNGAAIVVFPGGGYAHLALGHEGEEVAQWLISEGITAFILKYRHGPRYLHPAPLQDAARAVRTVRARSEEWGIDPDRIGVMGFSAGGHLASTLGTHFRRGKHFSRDPIERVKSRPDFMILVYPVITLVRKESHRGSLHNLLGPNPTDELKEELSNEKHVTKKTPPAFLVHTTADRSVSSANSALFYLALRDAGVPAELHIYEHGNHGFGLAREDPVLSTWPGLCTTWLRGRGLLEKP